LPLDSKADTIKFALKNVLDSTEKHKSRIRPRVSELEQRAQRGFEQLRTLLDRAPTATTPLLTGSSPSPSRVREDLQAKVKQAEKRLNAKKQELKTAQATIEKLLNSSSWRITAPLRWITRRSCKLRPSIISRKFKSVLSRNQREEA